MPDVLKLPHLAQNHGVTEVQVRAGGVRAQLDAQGADRLTFVPQGRAVMDRLAVPATPYLALVDARGTLRAALLPEEDTDLSGWLRQSRPPLSIREDSPS